MVFDITIWGALIAGLISFLSPCVLPLVPAYLGFLGGTTINQLTGEGDNIDRDAYLRVILAAVFFVLGLTTVFVALGAAASFIGGFITQYKNELGMIAGVLIIIFGLHFLGILKIPLLYRSARVDVEMESASFFGAYLMGLAFAFGWTPCVGPVLAPILTLAGSSETVYQGVGLLFVYAMGLGIPFILAAIAVTPFMGFMVKFRKHMSTVEKVMGLLLIITGALFINGSGGNIPINEVVIGVVLLVCVVAILLIPDDPNSGSFFSFLSYNNIIILGLLALITSSIFGWETYEKLIFTPAKALGFVLLFTGAMFAFGSRENQSLVTIVVGQVLTIFATMVLSPFIVFGLLLLLTGGLFLTSSEGRQQQGMAEAIITIFLTVVAVMFLDGSLAQFGINSVGNWLLERFPALASLG